MRGKNQRAAAGHAGKRYEASGVHFENGYLYVVFDDKPHILRIRPDWSTGEEAPTLIDTHVGGIGYEDITYQPFEERWYCLIEASETESGGFKPRIDAFDASFRFVASHWLDFPVKKENKGIEGLSYLRYRGENYILGLCEGNACKSGSAAAKQARDASRCSAGRTETGSTPAPSSCPRRCLSRITPPGVGVYVTVVSQVSSVMWVGRVRSDPTGLDDLFEDAGRNVSVPAQHGRPDHLLQRGRCDVAAGPQAGRRVRQGQVR